MLTTPIALVLSIASLGQTGSRPAEATGPAAPAAEAAAPALSPEAVTMAESKFFLRPVQLTSREKFIKAGEAYFSPDGEWIIFQAIEVPQAGKEADPFYAMYIAKLTRDANGRPSGLEKIQRVSKEHTANTCGWFHPKDPDRLIFGSTLVTPKDEGKSGFQVGTRSYKWMFPDEMEVCEVRRKREPEAQKASSIMDEPKALFERNNYDAECSFDSSGRFVLYAHVEDHKEGEKADANIYVYDTKLKKHTVLVNAKGYDGGPFFSPDGQWICYRSDRAGNDLLQLYVARVRWDNDAEGVPCPAAIRREYQLTNNESVNWAPFWHPSGKFLVYASSEFSHSNYEVFAIEVSNPVLEAARKSGKQAEPRRTRITFAEGADILPVFSSNGKYLMWTSQRGPKAAGEAKASSQLWIAEWRADVDPFSIVTPAAGK